MAPTRDRQRKLERARLQRRIARQAHQARRRRQVQAGVGSGVALILIILGAIWALGGFSPSAPTPAAATCIWTQLNTTNNPDLLDVGTPPTSGEKRTGTEPMTIQTNLGRIVIALDIAKSPCAASSFSFLASQDFFTNSSCSSLSEPLEVLQCGDPKSTGAGGPAYEFNDEYRPTAPINPSATPSVHPSSGLPPSATPPAASPTGSAAASAKPVATGDATYYRRGDVVLVNNGANTNGSQFYIIYGDTSPLSPAYTLIGQVSAGMDLVDKVVAGGAVGDNGKPSVQGKPKIPLTIQTLYVGAPPTPAPSNTPAITTS